MTIQIDDSGWGCPIGGVIIGGLRVETGEYAYEVIPVEQFQGDVFARRDYLDGARVATEKVLTRFDHTLNEPIQICTGFIHERTRAWFTQRSLGWGTTKVEGKLQTLIEQSLREYLRSLGFELKCSTEQYGNLFYSVIVWLKGGNPNAPMMAERIALAKTGWDSFAFYRDLPYRDAVAVSKAFRARKNAQRWRGRRYGYERDDE